jgi:hypothetical protein
MLAFTNGSVQSGARLTGWAGSDGPVNRLCKVKKSPPKSAKLFAKLPFHRSQRPEKPGSGKYKYFRGEEKGHLFRSWKKHMMKFMACLTFFPLPKRLSPPHPLQHLRGVTPQTKNNTKQICCQSGRKKIRLEWSLNRHKSGGTAAPA